ncbi:MAG TPA: hypothetical protein VMB18_19140 [Terriglobales bacterium]|nr:hypothetical protein [Terriglobales bacterium]
MKSLLRWLVGIFILLGTLLLSNCSPYGCRVTFGSSTCNGSGSSSFGGSGGGGSSGGGGGGATPTAFAYAVDQSGTIDGYVLSDSASTFGAISNFTAPTIAANSGGVGMVVAQEQYLYAGLGDSGGILYGWTISASGSLSPISGTPAAAPFLADFGTGVSQSEMIVNPAGTLLFISDTLQSLIYVFQIGTGGALTAVTGSPFSLPVGFQPMNLTTDGLGNYLYVVNGNFSTHQGSAIAAFVIGTGSNLGVLTPINNGVPFSGVGYNMWQVKGEPTGQFLIGTTGSTAYDGVTDDPNLYVFTISQSSTNPGAITLLGKTATQYSPYSIAVQSNTGGNLIYSLSFNDTATAFNPIEGFSISSAGALTADANSPFSNGIGEGSWGQFDQSGSLLFVYASYLNSSTNTVITQLSPLNVGSGGALTQPITTGTLANPGFWVVTDPQ